MAAIITRTGIKVTGKQAEACVKIGIAKWEKDIYKEPIIAPKEPKTTVAKKKPVKRRKITKK